MSIHIANVEIAIDTSEATEGFEDSHAIDCVNESLRGMQRSFEPQSAILDYRIGEVVAVSNAVSVEGYSEGDAFCDLVTPAVINSSEGTSSARPRAAEIVQALQGFIAQQEGRDAQEGLACEIAQSLKEEVETAGLSSLASLPPLKRALLDYVVEQAEQAALEA